MGDSRNYHHLDIIWARRRREKIEYSRRFTKGNHHFEGPKSQNFRACGGLQEVKNSFFFSPLQARKFGVLVCSPLIFHLIFISEFGSKFSQIVSLNWAGNWVGLGTLNVFTNVSALKGRAQIIGQPARTKIFGKKSVFRKFSRFFSRKKLFFGFSVLN